MPLTTQVSIIRNGNTIVADIVNLRASPAGVMSLEITRQNPIDDQPGPVETRSLTTEDFVAAGQGTAAQSAYNALIAAIEATAQNKWGTA